MTIEGATAVPGRPGAGELLKADMASAAAARPKRRDLKPLGKLWPFLAAHWGDAGLAAFFLLFSTAASLGLVAHVDHPRGTAFIDVREPALGGG